MAEPDEGERQREPRFNQEQYDMLKRCSDKQDMTEWNEWRKQAPGTKILLQRANLTGAWLRHADLQKADLYAAQLSHAALSFANLESAALVDAKLNGASLFATNLRKAKLGQSEAFEFTFGQLPGQPLVGVAQNIPWFTDLRRAQMLCADLRGARLSRAELSATDLRWAVVDGDTEAWKCRVDAYTDVRGMALDAIRIDPATRQLLEYNTRRRNWRDWYKDHRVLRWPVRLFWLASDYGLSTWRVIFSFGLLALVFAAVYRLWPGCLAVDGKVGDIRGFVHALYFSVVTMTTLGFGDIAANPDSTCGQVLPMLQVILGYVLLGALVTRFAVLFTAGGPAGKFADEKGMVERIRGFARRKFGRKEVV